MITISIRYSKCKHLKIANTFTQKTTKLKALEELAYLHQIT